MRYGLSSVRRTAADGEEPHLQAILLARRCINTRTLHPINLVFVVPPRVSLLELAVSAVHSCPKAVPSDDLQELVPVLDPYLPFLHRRPAAQQHTMRPIYCHIP